MGLRKALAFRDVARLADYARLGDPQARSVRGFTLYEVVDPERPRGTLLLLLGHSPRRRGVLARLSSLFSGGDPSYEAVEVREDDGALSLRHEDGWRPLRIRRRRHSTTLIELVSLERDPDPAPPPLLLCLADDPSLLGPLIIDSMALGNDRLALAAVGGQVLLRIESPSWYLIERTIDEGKLTLFTPLAESGGRVWLPWGWRHPLATLWTRSEAAAGDEWLLFQEGERRLRLAPPQWTDVYDATDVVLDFASTSTLLTAEALTERFTVPVRLSPRARPAEPTLWLVEETERATLDRMLLSLDEEDLEELLVAPVRAPGGPLRYFLRERRAGQGRRLLEASAVGFAPWQGISDLFLPAGLALEPRLRRDRYRVLFDLGHSHLTVLAPPPGGGPVERLQVPTAAFAPLSRLVDFHLTAEAARIEAIQAHSLFDFAPYSRAPSRPTQPTTSRARPSPAASSTPQSTTSDKPKTEKEKVTRPLTKTDPQLPSSTVLTDLEVAERELERQIIEEPTAARWAELGVVKGQLGRADDAVRCAIEAWWFSEARYDAESHERLLEALEDQLGLRGSMTARCRQLSAQPSQRRSVLAHAFHSRGLPEGQLPGWLAASESGLRAIEEGLPKKVRWLAWGELWRHNRDVRSQARVRESIVHALDSDGVSSLDLPVFIQRRLLHDRSLTVDGEGESQHALRNLQVVSEGLEALPEPLRAGGQAALGRLWCRSGRTDLGMRLLEAARDRAEDPLLVSWCDLQLREVLAPTAAADPRLGEGLDPFIRETFLTFAAALAARRESTDSDVFLSADNVARLFPTLHNTSIPKLEGSLRLMTQARRSSSHGVFSEAARSLLSNSVKELRRGADLRELSRVLFQAVRELSTFEKLVGQDGLTNHYKDAAGLLLKQLQGETDFFAILLQVSLGRGLIELKQPAAGARALRDATASLRAADLIALDLVDASASMLRAIEGTALDQRAVPLQGLVATIAEQAPKLPDLATTSATLQLLQVLDQLCESAASKDQLTLTRFRQYQDLDELIIRERVLREDFCT